MHSTIEHLLAMRTIFLFFIYCWVFLSQRHLWADPPWFKCEKRWGEAKVQGKRIVRYRLRGNNFPQGQRFLLVVKWFNGEEAETFAYVANRRGCLILEEDRRDDPLYALCPLKKGERIAFVMRSENDPSFFAETSVVPFPLSLKTKSGLKLSLELKAQEGNSFCLAGRGFNPGENCEMHFSFQGKDYHYSLTASSQGRINFPFTFELEDREGGTCSLILKRKNEEISFPFQAGRTALKLVGGFA